MGIRELNIKKAFMQEYALQYAQLGWHVFPVAPDKTPLTPNGHLNATTDPETIKGWWDRYPDAGIGISVGPSGLAVLDLDRRNGNDVPLDRLREEVGDFPMPIVAKTINGGMHIYYHAKVGLTSTTGLLGIPHIDLKAGKGYVIAPPSLGLKASGKRGRYKWVKSPFDHSIEDAPSFLKPKTRILNVQNNIIPEGQRNSALTTAAGHLRAAGLEGDMLIQAMLTLNAQRCDPPLPDNEVVRIVQSIMNYPPFKTNAPEPDEDGDEDAEADEGKAPTFDVTNLEELLHYEHTEKGFARMLAHVLGGYVRYNHTRSSWLVWNNTYWEPDEKGEVVQYALGTTDMYRRSTSYIQDTDERKDALKWARAISNRGKLTASMEFLKTDPVVRTVEYEWNPSPDHLATVNGVYDFTQPKFRTGLPEDYISNAVSTHYLPTEKCPRWLQFLNDVFLGDQEVIGFVQRAVGYSLTGYNTEQCLFLLVGSGANGKSVFLDTLIHMLGSYGCIVPFSTFTRPFNQNDRATNDIAMMAGKRLVVASEANEGALFDTARLKALTGGERVKARYLYQEYFEFEPIAKIWMGVNHLPVVRDDSDGFWRRMHKINFPRTFSPDEQDRYLKYTLRREFPGILNWAIEGANAWFSEGLNIPEQVKNATSIYRLDSDPLTSFLNDCCIVGDGLETGRDRLYTAYTSYMMDRRVKAHEILSMNKFHLLMQNKFKRPVDIDPSDTTPTYLGLKLKTLKSAKKKVKGMPDA